MIDLMQDVAAAILSVRLPISLWWLVAAMKTIGLVISLLAVYTEVKNFGCRNAPTLIGQLGFLGLFMLLNLTPSGPFGATASLISLIVYFAACSIMLGIARSTQREMYDQSHIKQDYC